MWDKAVRKVRVQRIAGKGKAAGLVCVFMLVLFFSCFCSGGNKDASVSVIRKGEPQVIWIASDIHFLSPGLTDGGALFTRTVESGDGKMVGDSEKIVDAFLVEALKNKPDALVLSGDLTFNGERESLEVLAGKLGSGRRL